MSANDGARFDVVVIGGGIVGLATSWQLSRLRPDLRIAILEAEPHLGTHQTSHNSGVVHAGVYYEPGSLKAAMCTRGKQLLEHFCAERGIRLDHNGKLVVATNESELEPLARIFERARRNGVTGVQQLDARGLREVEPAAIGLAAVHSPMTGVVDFAAVAAALAVELSERGVSVHTSWPVARIRHLGSATRLKGSHGGHITARAVVACAGLQADRLAGQAGDNVRVVPFRGGWFVLDSEVASEVRGSIYPVPDPRLPFLGVHVTRRIDGHVWAGPNAFLAFSRSDYYPWAIRFPDAKSAVTFPGLWKFASRHKTAAWTELKHDMSKRAYAHSLAKYLPAVRAQHLERGPMGIRAQAMSRQGHLLDDFVIYRDERVLHVVNAPSPAATSSLAIGEHLSRAVEEVLG